MSKYDLSQDLNSLLPKSLDDIIRKNREQLQLRLASEAELLAITKPLITSNLKGTLTEAFIYNRVNSLIEPILCLVGFNERGDAFHTSSLVGFDQKSNTVLTSNGSNYFIKSFVTGEPDVNLLIHICYTLHRDGLGEVFDVPEFFYR